MKLIIKKDILLIGYLCNYKIDNCLFNLFSMKTSN